MRQSLPSALLLICLAGLPVISGATQQAKKATNPPPELAHKKADLGEIRHRIDSLKKELNTNEESRANAADRLRESERQISRLQRELSEISDDRLATQNRLRQIEQQSKELGSNLEQQQNRLEKLLYRQYLRGSADSLQMLLNGDDPNQMARDLHYLSAIGHTRAELLGDIQGMLEKKKKLANETREQADRLVELEKQQQQRHAELNRQRAERQKVFSQISDKVSAQRKEIGNLQQNEKHLTQLVDRLTRQLAEQAAAKAAEIARQAELQKQRQKLASTKEIHPDTRPNLPRDVPSKEPPKPQTEQENRLDPVAGANFARQQGSLRLPVKGTVVGKFGATREGGGTWRGVFIRAGNGNDVKAIANGRVVFADWMRGFGNLLIVDHGDAYLSIYGNNEALLKQVGQTIKGGETIATVGNSGGNPDSGLYFELRHQGQPIDPLKWASLK